MMAISCRAKVRPGMRGVAVAYSDAGVAIGSTAPDFRKGLFCDALGVLL
jgi:hypothetical protein